MRHGSVRYGMGFLQNLPFLPQMSVTINSHKESEMFTAKDIENYNLNNYKDKIPENLLIGLVVWANQEHRVGHFLTAVLSNNLFEAFARADKESAAALRDIVMFVYNELPGQCWGSPEKVTAWIKHPDFGRQHHLQS